MKKLIYLFIVIIMGMVTLSSWAKFFDLNSHKLKTKGKIETIDFVQRHKGSPHWVIHYTYIVNDIKYSQRLSVASMPEDSIISIEYNSSDPIQNYIDEYRFYPIFWNIVLSALLIYLIFLYSKAKKEEDSKINF